MGDTARREAIYSPASLSNQETHPKVVALMKWAKQQQGFGIMLNWYMNRDISSFDCKQAAPKTQYRETAIQLSKTPLEAFALELKAWVNDHLEGMAAFTAPQLQVLCERWGHDSKAKAQYIRKALQPQGTIDPSKLIKVHGKPSRYTTFITSEVTLARRVEPTWSQVVTRTEDAMQRELEQNGSF
jgi:hypothetical protein